MGDVFAAVPHRTLVKLTAMLVMVTPAVVAQEPGSIVGTVRRADDASPLRGVLVVVAGSGIRTFTGGNGQFALLRVPAGQQTVRFQWPGYRPHEESITVTTGGTVTVDAVIAFQPVLLSEFVVTAPSRAPERVVEAPAAVSIVEPIVARDLSSTAQVPLALAKLPGVDVVQNGVNDFNLNTRGFNTSLNRRVLVLQDGRDVAIAFLGSQEWNAFSLPLEDMGRIEFVRGPGSALYGANSLTGVLNITTPTAREAVGTKLSLAGGELSTIRGDLRHGGVVADGRVGYRLSAGYARSESWTRSRTNIGDLAAEYSESADSVETLLNTPAPGFELRPLNGQVKAGPFGTPGPVTGEPDDLINVYGAGRLDVYLDNGSVVTAEGGATHILNETLVTGAGRVQVSDAWRPWARMAWAADQFNITAWYTGRKSKNGAILASAAPIDEESHVLHAEAQYHQTFLEGRGRFVIGGSARNSLIDSKQTLIAEADDDRSDWYFSGYAQAAFSVSPQLRLVGAARYDDGELFKGQVSPKAALIFSPNQRHSFRFTAQRAFQTPNTLEYFLSVVAGPPADFSLLEAGLRASPLGPALTGVPDGELFTNSAAIPVLGLGNPNLDVEHATTLEIGYKGQIGDHVFVTVDGYYSRFTNFVTDLLPGVNPTYAPWTAPAAVTDPEAQVVETAVRDQLFAAGEPLAAAGLTRLPDGTTAIVVSIGNAGEADAFGIELGTGVWLTHELRLDGSYTLFTWDVDSTTVVPGDQILADTPKHKGSVALSYIGANGVDARVSAQIVDDYEWASGVFAGRIPSRQTVDASVSYQISRNLRVHAVATNLLDQRRYQLYGGSIVGRRILGGFSVVY
jgi:iron complex outermembrane receptor protein